jgi:hypothetical protein
MCGSFIKMFFIWQLTFINAAEPWKKYSGGAPQGQSFVIITI